MSAASYPSGARTVVLARGDDYADALAGAPLAASLDAPILLTYSDRLAPEVRTELQRLHATRVMLLGGQGAIAEDVVRSLTAQGLAVERIAGRNRFETAARIAARLSTPHVYLVTAGTDGGAAGWPDAVAVAGLASALERPILLTAGGRLPEETLAALRGRTAVTLVGGTAAIPASVVSSLHARPGIATVDRLAGRDRYETFRRRGRRRPAGGAQTNDGVDRDRTELPGRADRGTGRWERRGPPPARGRVVARRVVGDPGMAHASRA